MGRMGHEAGIYSKHKRVCNECSTISVYFGTPTQSALTSPVIMNIALFSESSVSPRGGGGEVWCGPERIKTILI